MGPGTSVQARHPWTHSGSGKPLPPCDAPFAEGVCVARSLRSGWSGEDGGPGARPHLTAGSRPAPRGNTPRRDVRRERGSGPPAGLAPASAPHAGLRVPRHAREMPGRAEAAGGPSEGGGSASAPAQPTHHAAQGANPRGTAGRPGLCGNCRHCLRNVSVSLKAALKQVYS